MTNARQLRLWPVATILLCIGGASALAGSDNGDKKYGVYEYVIQSAVGSLDEVASAVEDAAVAEGWRVLSRIPSGVPEGCGYRAEVLALFSEDYARGLMRLNPTTGPFAMVDRINVFEDENGVHVAFLNPLSISRTVLLDDARYADVAAPHHEALRELIAGAVSGEPSSKQFGKLRKKGYIGRTFGVMAGGPFDEKIKDEVIVESANWRAVADKVRVGLSKTGPKWGLHSVYEIELPEHETVVFGSTGTPLDSKSYDIVKAGSDKSRRSCSYPGLAHAAAYPVEVVVARDGERVAVRIVDTMYRMKMYFEDAGKWAFMKNMGMPGSIHDELEAQIREGLASSPRSVSTAAAQPAAR